MKKVKPIGYKYIEDYLQQHNIAILPYFRESYISESSTYKTIQENDTEIHLYPKKYETEDNLFSNLEFAIKHEGLNLLLIKKLFEVLTEAEVKSYILSNSKGKYNRIIWFLYEWSLNKQLDIPDLQTTNYIDILDSKEYYTCKPDKLKRYCINDNLTGNRFFCPVVRKTEVLRNFENKKLDLKAQEILHEFDPYIIYRAINYLYTKESLDSFEIEREKPSGERLAKFQKLLEDLNKHSFKLSKDDLIDLQNIIADKIYQDKDYRDKQIFVGSLHYGSGSLSSPKVEYIAPKSDNLPALMQGFIDASNKIIDSDIPAIVAASIIAFGFVYIHPFSDGNGRIHRFLIHYVLAEKHFTAENIIFPVSATMLKDRISYDKALEVFSKPLMPLIQYYFGSYGFMVVKNNTEDFYKFIDLTKQAEYLYNCIESTINNEFLNELKFLSSYDVAKSEIQEIFEMPDNQLDLLIKFIIQNKGKLSKNKKAKYFDFLDENQLAEIENVINEHFSFLFIVKKQKDLVPKISHI